MGYDNLNIELKGIKSTGKLKRVIYRVADAIHWQSPSDACLKVVCEQTKEAIKGSCRVVSRAGIFVAETVSECPEKCLRKLERKIKRQLDDWKRNRFSDLFSNQLDNLS